jgi:hypothetical protein
MAIPLAGRAANALILGLDADDAQTHARLNEIIENFRVEVDTEIAEMRKAQLVRKSGTQAY